jgi:hypothetical protein
MAHRIVWALVGAAVVAPGVWIWASLVCASEKRASRNAETRAHIETCAKNNGIAVMVLNSGTVSCVSGSGRKQ